MEGYLNFTLISVCILMILSMSQCVQINKLKGIVENVDANAAEAANKATEVKENCFN